MNCVICIGKCPGEQHVTLRQQTTSQHCGDHAGPPGVLLEDRRHHRQARSYNGTYNLSLSPTILPKQIQTIINNVQRFNLSKQNISPDSIQNSSHSAQKNLSFRHANW